MNLKAKALWIVCYDRLITAQSEGKPYKLGLHTKHSIDMTMQKELPILEGIGRIVFTPVYSQSEVYKDFKTGDKVINTKTGEKGIVSDYFGDFLQGRMKGYYVLDGRPVLGKHLKKLWRTT